MIEPIITVATERRGFFPAWKYPQYRLLWVSAVLTYVGRWMETVVGAWLVLELTNSPFLVGILGTYRFAAMLLGPFCGTVSDRFNRRRILIAAQIIYAIISFIIMVLFFTSQLEVWHLFAFTFIGGLCNTLDLSVRYAIAANIVKSHQITSTIALLLVAMGITSILGPLLGGGLLEVIGASGSFALITASFLLSFLVLLPMKITAPEKSISHTPMLKSTIDGLRYIRRSKVLFSLILLAALVNLFVFPYWFTLLPLFARDILHAGVNGFGQLMAAIGLGAIAGSLIVEALPNSVNKGKLTIITLIAWPAVVIVFSLSRLFPLSMVLLFFAGMVQGMAMALIMILLLLHSSEEMWGRVSGARALAVATLPFGNLLAGIEATYWGAPLVVLVNGLASILITILIAIWASSSPLPKMIKPRQKTA